MKIHLVNPNSTHAMTEMAGVAARGVVVAGTEINLTTVAGAPASIEGHADAALAIPGLLNAIRDAEKRGVDAHVIACFDDPGLYAAREIATKPVLGICQTALQVASTLAARFVIITTLPRSITIIEDLVEAYGFHAQCRKVRCVEMAVLDLERDIDTTFNKILSEIEQAKHEDAAEAIILGCAGMAELCDRLGQSADIPVIDGVSATVKIAEAYVGLGYKTSKLNSYAPPLSKDGGFHLDI